MARKLLKYDRSLLTKALEEIDNKETSVKAAAKKYGIPRTTLIRHKQRPHDELKIGRKPVFSKEQEKFLATYVINLAKVGFPLTKENFLHTVSKFASSLKIDFKASRNWHDRFMRTHKVLAHRAYQTLTKQRAAVKPEHIDGWFKEVEQYIHENSLEDVLKDPRRVYNADETAFYLNPKGAKVLAARGSKTVYVANANDEKENVTVLINGNANGDLAPPMVVFRYKRVPEHIAVSVPENWVVGRSDSGWMTQETMFEYMSNYFYPYLVNNNIPRPVLFFMDGHVSHLSLDLATFCSEKGIVLIALYPNATHLLQPLDVAVFKGLKSHWKNKVHDFRMKNDFKEIKKSDFCPLLNDVLTEIDKNIFTNGFKKCGLVPWSKEAVVVPLQAEPEIPVEACRTEPTLQSGSCLLRLEREIGAAKIQDFSKNEGEWKGYAGDESLYYLWKETVSAVQQEKESEAGPSRQDLVMPSEELNWEPHDTFLNESEDGPSETAQDFEMQTEKPDREPVGASRQESIAGPSGERQSFEMLLEQPTEDPPTLNALQDSEDGPRVLQDTGMQAELPSERYKKAYNFIIPSPFKNHLLFRPNEKSKMGTRKQKVRLPAVVTSPEMIEYFKKKEEAKKAAIEKRTEMQKRRELRKKENEEKKKTAAAQKKLKKKQKKKPVKRALSFDSTSEESFNESQLGDSDEDIDWGEVDECCIICNEYGKTEMWFMCGVCKKWAHKECSGVEKPQDFICDFCQSP